MRHSTLIAALCLSLMPAAALAKGSSSHSSSSSHSVSVSHSAPASHPVAVSHPVTMSHPTSVAHAMSNPPPMSTIRSTRGRVSLAKTPIARTGSPRATAEKPNRSTATPYAGGLGRFGGSITKAPAQMPFWWPTIIHRPYTPSVYDRLLQQCMMTPKERRSQACLRMLRERGIG